MSSAAAARERVVDHFVRVPIVRDNRGRPAAFFGVTDFTTPIDCGVVEDMAEAMVAEFVQGHPFESANDTPAAAGGSSGGGDATMLPPVDLVVSIADRSSGPLAHAVARRLGVPYSLANWYPIGSPGEVPIEQCAGFSGSGVIYLNGVKRGNRVWIVMDVLKTGATAANLAKGVAAAGGHLVQLSFGCELLEYEGRGVLGEQHSVHCLVGVHLRGEETKEGGGASRAIVNPPKRAPVTSQISLLKQMSPELVQEKIARVTATFVGVPIHRNPHLSYPYSFFALTDFVPVLAPQLVEDMADLCIFYGDFTRCDVIVSEADRGGGPLVQACSVRTGLPYVLANWYPSGEGVGASSAAQVGFSGEGRIVLNGVRSEDRCIFVDDMLSSGGTAEGVVKSIVQLGGVPVEGVFISEKLYPPKKAGGLPDRKGKARLNSIFPHFDVTTVAQFVAEGDMTKAPPNRIGDF